MSDTKFPEAQDFYGMNELANRPNEDLFYWEDEVRDWFKRCMEDHPDEDNDENDKYSWASPPSCTDWDEWFEKWFSQFEEE